MTKSCWIVQPKTAEFVRNCLSIMMKKPTNSFLYSLVMDTYSFGYSSAAFTDMPINHKVFLASLMPLKRSPARKSCVMVGRCADYALSEHPGAISVFIHADLDKRIDRISRKI